MSSPLASFLQASLSTKKSVRRKGAYSVGHVDITAGTYGTAVYRILPGGSVNPPRHGLGIPRSWYILSNNHVLANSNDANIGDLILQPGPFDGGTDPEDAIARLRAFVPITFFPPVPLAFHKTLWMLPLPREKITTWTAKSTGLGI